jgi:uncharacterized membrane protein YesL
MNVLFRKDYAKPGPGIDPDEPEKTGFSRFFQILQIEYSSLVKLNLLFLLCCLPIVTIPPALFAMNYVVRRMVLDQPVDCVYHFRTAFRQNWKRSYAPFLLVVLVLLCSGGGALFYLRYAESNPLCFLPFVLCSTVFLVTLLASTYFYGLLVDGGSLKEALRLSVLLGVGRPLRAIVAILIGYGLLVAGILAFPISIVYLVFIGFSLPCLLCGFYVRTVLKPYYHKPVEADA